MLNHIFPGSSAVERSPVKRLVVGSNPTRGAKEVVIKTGKASASLIQRKLKIGYVQASRILDELERQKIVSSTNGTKPREVLIKMTS